MLKVIHILPSNAIGGAPMNVSRIVGLTEDAFDHKNLNEEVPEFLDLIPTAENMAVVIYQKLIPHLNNKHDLSVTLYETPRNYVTFSG